VEVKKVLSFVFILCLTLILFSENNKFYFEIGPNYGFAKKYYQCGEEIYSIVKKDYDKHDKKLCLDMNSKIGIVVNDKFFVKFGYYRTNYSFNASTYYKHINGDVYVSKIESKHTQHFIAPGIIYYPLKNIQLSVSIGSFFGSIENKNINYEKSGSFDGGSIDNDSIHLNSAIGKEFSVAYDFNKNNLHGILIGLKYFNSTAKVYEGYFYEWDNSGFKENDYHIVSLFVNYKLIK
jgi:hypothetical protein